MSGLARTLQKRALKRMGYTRQTQQVSVRNGRPFIERLKKGVGHIFNPAGESTGSRRWPGLVPA